MKLFTSLCRFCIVRFFGVGMKVRPLRNTFFCVSDRVVSVAKITNASSAVCGWVVNVFGLGGSGLGLEVGVWLGCGSLSSNIILLLFERSCM